MTLNKTKSHTDAFKISLPIVILVEEVSKTVIVPVLVLVTLTVYCSCTSLSEYRNIGGSHDKVRALLVCTAALRFVGGSGAPAEKWR